MAKKKNKNEKSDIVNTEEIVVKASEPEEDTDEVVVGIPPKEKDIGVLQNYFGKRSISAFDNSEILRTRFLYQIESAHYENCYDITNKQTGALIGVVTALQLKYAWRMANTSDAKKVTKTPLFYINEKEWKEDYDRLSEYILKKRLKDSKANILFSDVWEIPESEYEMIGLKKPKQVMAVLQTAILGEIEENRRLLATWKKIKKYPHKVSILKSRGGVFSKNDAIKLSSIKIKTLNDIKKHSIFELKRLILDHDFEQFIKEINTAFKNDLERRRDFRYKVYPFVAAFKNLAIIIGSSYYFKYTLIKNSIFTILIFALLGVTAIEALTIFLGGIRRKKRMLVRPNYVFYTSKVKASIAGFAMVTVFSIVSLFVFYLRYDGYNSTLYYRDLEDGTITIAGLRNPDLNTLNETGIDASALQTISVPAEIDGKTVTEIDEKAFRKDTFKYIELPGTLKTIHEDAFYRCETLYEIEIPESVTVIDSAAFERCTSLSNVTIPSGVSVIEPDTFLDTALKTITFREGGSITIKESAFENCESLSTINNMSSVKSIEKKAFKDCSMLSKFEFGSTLETIGESAFENCAGINTLVIPDTVISIGKDAFKSCTGIKTLKVPYGGRSASESANQSISEIFSENGGTLVDLTITGTNPISATSFAGLEWISTLTIEDTITTISDGAFNSLVNLTFVDFTSGINEIPNNLFKDCVLLNTVTGIENVNKVGVSSFSGCSSLSSIDLSGITVFSDSSFALCKRLNRITFSDSLTSIPKNCFTGTAITELNLPASVTSIGASAFASCASLNSDLDLSFVTDIGESAFAGASKITSITFSENIKTIGKEAFKGCAALTEIVIPNSITSLGTGAFIECNKIREIVIPFIGNSASTVSNGSLSNFFSLGTNGGAVVYVTAMTKIYNSNFSSNTGIEEIVILSELTEIESDAFKNTKITTLVLPETMKQIPANLFSEHAFISSVSGSGIETVGDYAFKNAHNLYEINFPNLVSVGSNSFVSCSLLSDLGNISALESVGMSAFMYCSSLTSFPSTSALKNIGEQAFFECYNLYNLGDLSSVENIGSRAFASCPFETVGNLTNLKTLGESVFKDCSYIKKIVLPSGMTSVGKYAFKDSRISEVVLSEGITAIEEGAFKDCNYLTTVTFPSTLTSIGKEAFYGCEAVSKFDLYELNSLTSIGEAAFMNCTYLGEITLPYTIEYLSKSMFENCSSLSNVIGLNYYALKTIGERAFYACSWLSGTLELPSGLTNIGENAFYDTGFSTIVVPKSVVEIGENAFASCSSITDATIPFLGKNATDSSNGGYMWTFGDDGMRIKTLKLTASVVIYTNSLDGSENTLTELVLDEGVKEIQASAFEGNYYISKITLPTTLEKIGSYAFDGCSSIVTITIPDTITVIEEGTFRSCTSLRTINFPANLKTISMKAFEGCSYIEELYLPDGIKEICDEAFINCNYIYSVEFPATLEKIGNKAFQGCTYLSSISVNGALTSLGEYAFAECVNLENVNLGNSLTAISAYTFRNCSSLDSIVIPNSVTTIGESAFASCTFLSTIVISENVTEIGKRAFEGCSSLYSVELPVGLTVINEETFYGCYDLTYVNFSEINLKKICSQAFYSTSLVDIVFNDKLEEIEANAFIYCDSLESITFEGNDVNIPKNLFGYNFDLQIYVNNEALFEKLTELFDGTSIEIILN